MFLGIVRDPPALPPLAASQAAADPDADDHRLATPHSAHAHVPLGEVAPTGHDPRPVPEGYRPAHEALADLSGLMAAYVLTWPTESPSCVR